MVFTHLLGRGVFFYKLQAFNGVWLVKRLRFFYHSVVGKKIMGIVKVCASYKDDPTDNSGKFGMVDVEYVETLKTPVTLEQIKQRKELQDLALIKQSRLSVMPIMLEEWECILKLAINNISLAT